MELALNVVWLLVCAASFACWGRRNMRGRGSLRRLRALQGLLPLGFALLLLFPVISITDDLQALQVPQKEPSPKRIMKCLARCFSPASFKAPDTQIGFGLFGLLIFCWRSLGHVLATDLTVAATRPFPRFEIRGPPCC